MANELKHKTVGTELTQNEFEGVGLHVFDSQATGDIAYASSGTQISRLAKGTDGDTLTLASGIPAWNTAVQNDVASSRAVDTIYQNTSGRPLLVTITIQLDESDQARIQTDANATPTTTVAYLAPNNSGYLIAPVTFLVLPSNYYRLVQAVGTLSIEHWFEWEI